MQGVLEIGLSNAVLACAAAAVAVAAGLCCRRPALVHALWLLVLVKLITPPLFRVPLPWPGERRQAAVVAESPATPADPAPVPEVGEAVELPFKEPDWFEPEKASPDPPIGPVLVPDDAPEIAPVAVWSIGWSEILAGLWLAGSLSWFTLATGRAWRFSHS